MDFEEFNRRKELDRLRCEYLTYSQRRNGLGKILAGVVLLVVCLINWVIPPGVVDAGLTIGLTLLWLVGKEIIRQCYYQPFGKAQESWLPVEKGAFLAILAFLVLLVLEGWEIAILTGRLIHPQYWGPLFFLTAFLPITWLYLRSASELAAGWLLLLAYVVTSKGVVFDLISQYPYTFPCLGLLLLLVGLWEEHQFGKLVRQVGEVR